MSHWQAIDQCPASVVITDRDGRIRYVNRAFTLATGYESEECLGKNPRLLKSGHHPRAFYEHLWGTILAGGVWRGELLNRRKNGDRYWESATIAPYSDENGQTGFVAVKQEVSRLKKLETRLGKLLGQIQEGYLEMVEGVVLRANPAAALLLSFGRPEELVGQSVLVEAGEGSCRLKARDGSVRTFRSRTLEPPPELALLFDSSG